MADISAWHVFLDLSLCHDVFQECSDVNIVVLDAVEVCHTGLISTLIQVTKEWPLVSCNKSYSLKSLIHRTIMHG